MIPSFTISGHLPPFVGADATQRAGTSPFLTSVTEVVQRFGFTPERIAILKGLLAYRGRLRGLGATTGLQILDGSFFEDVEGLRGRPPDDVDLLTFTRLPFATLAQTRELIGQNEDIFDPIQCKAAFKCHSFFVDLNKNPELIVADTIYLFGLFSHQKDTKLWKGTLAIPFDASDDEATMMLEGDP